MTATERLLWSWEETWVQAKRLERTMRASTAPLTRDVECDDDEPLPLKVFGVPRGGTYVAAMIGQPCASPATADFMVDDLIDSGETMKRYKEEWPNLPFYALFDKRIPRRQGLEQWIVFPWEVERDESPAEDAALRLLQMIGENSEREGLRDTPARFIKAMKQLTEGYATNPGDALSATFTSTVDQMVMVRDIPYWSLCEHHMLPFNGSVTVGYIPNGRVVGLSKIPRLVRAFSRRLQIQENMTQQIANAMQNVLAPLGVGVIVTGHHSCMAMRGVETTGEMVTSALLGAMRDDTAAREEFFNMANA